VSFRNEPILELRRAPERDALLQALRGLDSRLPLAVPVLIGGDRGAAAGLDSTDPGTPERLVATAGEAGATDAQAAVEAAQRGFAEWSARPAAQRAEALRGAAARLRERRLELAALQVRECAKPWPEADADVCEAIDFLEYYAAEALELDRGRERRDRAKRLAGLLLHQLLESPGADPIRQGRAPDVNDASHAEGKDERSQQPPPARRRAPSARDGQPAAEEGCRHDEPGNAVQEERLLGGFGQGHPEPAAQPAGLRRDRQQVEARGHHEGGGDHRAGGVAALPVAEQRQPDHGQPHQERRVVDEHVEGYGDDRERQAGKDEQQQGRGKQGDEHRHHEDEASSNVGRHPGSKTHAPRSRVAHPLMPPA